MPAPKLPAQFSLFRQRGARGFDLPTRFYDPEKEARNERLQQARERAERTGLLDEDRARMAQRMRHSWQRRSSDGNRLTRLAVIMGGVLVILYFIIKAFGLMPI